MRLVKYAGSSLGMDVDLYDGKSLVVYLVCESGLVADWNKARSASGWQTVKVTRKPHMAMGHNLWLHFGVDEHPCTTYFDVHQGYRVLTQSHISDSLLLGEGQKPCGAHT